MSEDGAPETTTPVVVANGTEEDGFIPAYILKNVGVPIPLYRMTDGQRTPVSDELGADFVIETKHLRFDANAVSAIEDAFDGLRAVVPIIQRTVVQGEGGQPLEGPAGLVYNEEVVGSEERVFYGLEAFQKAMDVKPVRTIRDAMAIAFRLDPEEMGRRMIDTEQITYQNAVGVAWAIAQGVDPSDAAKMLQRVKVAVAAKRAVLASELSKTMDEALDETTDTPGNPG